MSEPNTEGHLRKASKKTGLGRGLGSLLGGSEGAFSKNTSDLRGLMEPKSQSSVTADQAPAELSGAVEQDQQPQLPTDRIWQIAVANIYPNPNQPRKNFDSKALDELASSLKQKGVIQPILVRKTADGKFQIIAGERR